LIPQSGEEIARLALIARAIDTAVLLCSADGRIEWANAEFTRATGYALDEAVGHRRTELMHGPFVRTDVFKRLDDDLAAGRAVDVEFMSLTKAGRPLWSELQLRPVDDGGVTRLIGTERDITVRRQAEEKARATIRRAESLTVALRHEKRLLTSVLETIPVGVWWKNTDLRFVGCNDTYLGYRGLASQADVIGRLESQLPQPGKILAITVDGAPWTEGDIEPHELIDRLESPVISTGAPSPDVRVTWTSPDGSRTREHSIKIMPHRGADQELEGVIGVAADITHVTELERQLAQANRLESIGQLAAGIAHEINTPIQFVSDNTRFLSDSFGGILPSLQEMAGLIEGARGGAPAGGELIERLGEYVTGLDLEFIADEVPSALSQSLEGLDRVAKIVRAMKDFSHPGEGKHETDLNRAVESTVQVARNEWKYVAHLKLDLDPGVGKVPCYEGELKQVVLNIIINAAHALGEQRERGEATGMGNIEVRTRREGETVRIEVEDDGPGMPDEVRARVFDPFFTTKPVGRGTGQGLSLAHSVVVQKHEGMIDIVTAPGQGATFIVTVPAPLPGAASTAPAGADLFATPRAVGAS
jgi:two-component system NtrC family sensor kinase